MPIIAPSILNADYGHLADEIKMLNESEAEWIHLDIMDGIFVPNISFGIPVVETVNKLSDKFLDVHLMIQKPDKYIEAFQKAGADGITVHIEADHNLEQTLKATREKGCKSAVSLKPQTPVKDLFPFLQYTDMVLVMSVNPGFGNQKFIEESYDRIRELKKYILDHQLDVKIEVDGGVNDKNISQLAEAGVDCFVVGSYIFKSDQPKETIKNLKNLASKHVV